MRSFTRYLFTMIFLPFLAACTGVALAAIGAMWLGYLDPDDVSYTLGLSKEPYVEEQWQQWIASLRDAYALSSKPLTILIILLAIGMGVLMGLKRTALKR